MIDIGATRSFIAQRALRRLPHSVIHSIPSLAHLGDGSSTLNILGEVRLIITFGGLRIPAHVLVAKTLNTDFILGGDWCITYGARIDYDTHQVSIRSSHLQVSVPFHTQIGTLSLPVRLLHSVQIPARETCAVLAHLQLSSADTVDFYPDSVLQTDKSIIIPNALLKVHNYRTY